MSKPLLAIKFMVQAYQRAKPELEITKINNLKQLWGLEKR